MPNLQRFVTPPAGMDRTVSPPQIMGGYPQVAEPSAMSAAEIAGTPFGDLPFRIRKQIEGGGPQSARRRRAEQHDARFRAADTEQRAAAERERYRQAKFIQPEITKEKVAKTEAEGAASVAETRAGADRFKAILESTTKLELGKMEDVAATLDREQVATLAAQENEIKMLAEQRERMDPARKAEVESLKQDNITRGTLIAALAEVAGTKGSDAAQDVIRSQIAAVTQDISGKLDALRETTQAAASEVADGGMPEDLPGAVPPEVEAMYDKLRAIPANTRTLEQESTLKGIRRKYLKG